MADFFEIDFLDVESDKSGDAIPLRYQIAGTTRIHVTDGGFLSTGDTVVEHINKYYDSPSFLDAIIVSHPDGDHAVGLRKLLEEYEIGELWMLRPWFYADELIDRFSRLTSVENLKKRLKELYPNLAALEELALAKAVPIREPFQGSCIGAFTVMAPTKARYLDLIVESEKTPVPITADEQIRKLWEKAITCIRAAWGEETFATEDTSSENNMSIIQYANLCGKKILLTADAGRAALAEAADFAPYLGLTLPGIDRIQVPHHGSRHNVSTELLNRWVGPKLSSKPNAGEELFTAIVSAAKKDNHHPRKSVVRAFIHRGAKVITTEGGSKRTGHNAPDRTGWVTVEGVPYPDEQEN